MIKKIFTALYADENILYFNEGSGDVIFNCSGMGILNIDRNNISLGDKFDEDDPDLWLSVLNLENARVK